MQVLYRLISHYSNYYLRSTGVSLTKHSFPKSFLAMFVLAGDNSLTYAE